MAVSRPLHLTRLNDVAPRHDAHDLLDADVDVDVDATAPHADGDTAQRPPATLRPPRKLLLAMEGRVALELVAGLAARPWLSQLDPGDGHTVIVFPGLGASDISTLPLRRFLIKQGYDVQRWGQGLNLGPRDGVLDACRALVRHHAARSGRPVSLIGWSLGGVYARELAKEMPELVRCVITLGSPFSGPPQSTNAWRFFEIVSGQSAEQHELAANLHVAPPVPTTSIYSRTDGVVAWQASLNEPGPLTENIEVQASHLGMAANPIAQYAVADRLRQDPTRWRAFDAQGARKWFFKAAPTRSAAWQEAVA